MRILVCGGRDFKDQHKVNLVLDGLQMKHNHIFIIEGGAIGADRLAQNWAKEIHGIIPEFVNYKTFKADWGTHGKAAGPIRNQQMIDEGKPDLVVAFPGGAGTADMVRRAKKAGIEVREVTY